MRKFIKCIFIRITSLLHPLFVFKSRFSSIIFHFSLERRMRVEIHDNTRNNSNLARTSQADKRVMHRAFSSSSYAPTVNKKTTMGFYVFLPSLCSLCLVNFGYVYLRSRSHARQPIGCHDKLNIIIGIRLSRYTSRNRATILSIRIRSYGR